MKVPGSTAYDNRWKKIADYYGYDINHKKNGVMLPGLLKLACHLGVPLHNSNHSNTIPRYPDEVSRCIRKVKNKEAKGYYCKEGGHVKLNKDMNSISRILLAQISNFTLTLTVDGLDYNTKKIERAVKI